MDLQKKIRNLDEGLTIYSQLLKDEETILIPFAFSQYVTGMSRDWYLSSADRKKKRRNKDNKPPKIYSKWE